MYMSFGTDDLAQRKRELNFLEMDSYTAAFVDVNFEQIMKITAIYEQKDNLQILLVFFQNICQKLSLALASCLSDADTSQLHERFYPKLCFFQALCCGITQIAEDVLLQFLNGHILPLLFQLLKHTVHSCHMDEIARLLLQVALVIAGTLTGSAADQFSLSMHQ